MLASPDDLSEISEFIRHHWRSDHIFVKDAEFFRDEMCPFGIPNFVIFRFRDRIIGILGFTQSSSVVRESDLFLVLFKVLQTKGVSNPGAQMLKFVKGLTSKGIHTIGANPRVISYYKFNGFKVGMMDHFVWLNPEYSRYYSNYHINIGAGYEPLKSPDTSNFFFNKYSSECSLEFIDGRLDSSQMNNKDSRFFYRRYSCHSYYEYDFIFPFDALGFGVIRSVRMGDLIGIRIVDWNGKISLFYKFLNHVLTACAERGFAYVDLYCTGIETSAIISCGFSLATDSYYAPNYHEPLLWKRIDLPFVTTSQITPIFFRGDCDQDRPSIARGSYEDNYVPLCTSRAKRPSGAF